MSPRHHLTLIDLMATVAAAALAMGVFAWRGIPPGREWRLFIALSVPLVGIVWDRWRGGRGILGGALAGAAEFGVELIWGIIDARSPAQIGPTVLGKDPILVVYLIGGYVTFGTLMGVAAWLVAAALGQSVRPRVPDPNDQLARQR